MHFTRDEYDTMVNELLYCTPIVFDTLCKIVEATIRSAVEKWCELEDCLRDRGYENEIMQEIHLRLMKTTISGFLIRDDIEGPYNNNPEGFEDWLFTVAKNIKRDFANKVRGRDFKIKDIDDPQIEEIPSDDDCYDFEKEEHIERLKWAFSVVISSDVSVYKVLTWLAQFVFMISMDITKIESNEQILAAFEEKTLYEMYDMILNASKKISWIVITEQQKEKILCALRKMRIGTVSYGETKYKDFFMKQNGEISGKKSISDWVNRMNNIIRCQTDNIGLEKRGKTDNGTDRKKGGSGNEASDS